MEKQQLKESKKPTFSSFRRPNFSNEGISSISNIETPTKGNIFNPSPISKTNEQRVLGDTTKKRCFKCQGIRHLQADCLNRKAIMYIGDQLIELDNVEDEPKDNQ